ATLEQRFAELLDRVADWSDASEPRHHYALHLSPHTSHAVAEKIYDATGLAGSSPRSFSTPRTTSPTVFNEFRLSSGISMENISSTAKLKLILSSESICNSSNVVSMR